MGFCTNAPALNGRAIFGLGENGGLKWFVEVPSPPIGGVPMPCHRKFDTVAAAQAEALRLGPIGGSVGVEGA